MPEILEAEIITSRPFVAEPLSATGGPITVYQPTPTFPYQNQQAPIPPAAHTPGIDPAWEESTYTDAAGNRRWKPPGGFEQDFDIYDDLTGPPRIPDPVPPAGIGGLAGDALPSIAGGIVTGIATGAATGSVAQGVGAGVGATVGEIAGAAAGAAAGSILGPAGTAIGGIVGGAVGGAIGGAVGQAIGKMIDPNDLGDDPITVEDLEIPFPGGQCPTWYTIRTSGSYLGGNYNHTASALGPLRGFSVRPSGGTFNGEPAYNLQVLQGDGNWTSVTLFINMSPQDAGTWKANQITPSDGSADSCGDPAPSKPVTRVQPAVRVRGLPAGGFPPILLPELPDNLPGMPGPDTGRPVDRSPDIPPDAEPLPQPELPGNEDYPYPDPLPPPVAPPQPAPDVEPRDRAPRQPPAPRPPADDCACSLPIMRELEGIKQKLDADECEEPEVEPMTLQAIACEETATVTAENYSQAFAHLSQQLAHIKAEICELETTAAIPEWWQVRIGAERPQLVVLYAEKLPGGKFGRSRWPLTIPHYTGNPKPQLPSYRKGQWQGMLVLKDNSKVICYASSAAEAEKVIRGVVPYIKSSMVPRPFQVYTGQRKGAPLRQVQVVAKSCQYFPNGQKDSLPEWSKSL